MYKSRNDIITDKKVRYRKEVKSSTHIIWIMIIASLAMGAGFIYESSSKNVQIHTSVYSENELFVRKSHYKAQTKQVSNKVTNSRSFTTPLYTTKSSQHRRSSSGRTKAQRANTQNCLYWYKKYNEDHSNYSQLMQNDACERAAIKVKPRPPSQNTVVHNYYYQDKRQVNKQANKDVLIQRCTRYKKELERIEARMRSGYTASQYNWLESTRKKWRNKLFDECQSLSINSY